MKKIIIVQTSGNELANQLWNYSSVYAYSLEKGYLLENPSFFEYGNYFNSRSCGALFKFFFFNPFTDYIGRKTSIKRKIWRKLYFAYAKLTLKYNRNNSIIYKSSDNLPYYLPPSSPSSEGLLNLENTNRNIYLDSWLFRNPKGLIKYRSEILEYLRPRKDIEDRTFAIINDLRNKYKKIIAVHIRQSDYKTWKNGAYYIEQERVREIIDEYIIQFKINTDSTCFLFTSDGKIEQNIFEGLNIYISKENAVIDLFLLSKADYIIGSDSTFGSFASYIGDIPILIMSKDRIDWQYYMSKDRYFENKYSTMVHY